MRTHAIQAFHIMHFEQRGETELNGQDLEVHDLRLGEALGDQQDGIGAGRAALPDLPRIHDEVLAQHGQRHMLADLLDELQASAEVGLIGEAADRRRTRGVIACGDVHGIEVGTNEPSRRALALHLGDDARSHGRALGHHGLEEVAWRRHAGHALAKQLEWRMLHALGHFGSLPVHDLLQRVGGHGNS